MQKYKLRCNYCGYENHKIKWWLKLKLIFKDKYFYHCPNCHKLNCYWYFFHLRHDSTDIKEKEQNKNKLWDDRYG